MASLTIGLAAAALTTAVPASGQELVTNGGFETGTFSGWTAAGSEGIIDTLEPHSGVYDALFIYTGPASIEQTLVTDVGQSYLISFWLRNDGDPPSSFTASFDGSSFVSLLNPDPFAYTFFSYTGTASTTSTALRFTFSKGPGAFFFDDVSVQEVNGAIPEPSTWAMMLLGFGAVGAAMRSARRKQKVTVTYA